MALPQAGKENDGSSEELFKLHSKDPVLDGELGKNQTDPEERHIMGMAVEPEHFSCSDCSLWVQALSRDCSDP